MNHHMHWTWGPDKRYHRPARKELNESYYTGEARASELHDLLNCHNRPDGEGIHMPVGEISKVEGYQKGSGLFY